MKSKIVYRTEAELSLTEDDLDFLLEMASQSEQAEHIAAAAYDGFIFKWTQENSLQSLRATQQQVLLCMTVLPVGDLRAKFQVLLDDMRECEQRANALVAASQ